MPAKQTISTSLTEPLIHSASQDYVGWEDATFPAKLTAVTAGSGSLAGYWLYSWSEETIDPTTGLLIDASPGRSGTATSAYALEVNNAHLTTFPVYVEMRLRGSSAGSPVYEFAYEQGAGGTLSLYNSTTLVDGAVTRIDSDANGVLTWSEITAGHVQVVVALATTSQDGVVSTAAQTWLGDKTVQGGVPGLSATIAGDWTLFGPGGNGGSETLAGIGGSNNTSAAVVAIGFDSSNGYAVLGCYASNGLSFPSNVAYAVRGASGLKVGATGTGGGGDTFTGGICTTLGTGGGGTGTVTNIATTSPILGGPITTTGTISHATSGVTAGSYTSANITVDANGHVTAAANGGGATQSPGYILAYLYVATDESTTSTSFVDLATAESVTINLNATSNVLVEYCATNYNSVQGAGSNTEVYLDNTAQTASDYGINAAVANYGAAFVFSYRLTNLAAGSHIIDIKHMVSSGTGHWLSRGLKVSICP